MSQAADSSRLWGEKPAVDSTTRPGEPGVGMGGGGGTSWQIWVRVSQPHATVPLKLWELTVSRHPYGKAFLQSTVLAAVSTGSINQTVLLTRTGVGGIALLTSPEKAL